MAGTLWPEDPGVYLRPGV